MDEAALPVTRLKPDPATNAASMLLRLGFAIFALVIPSATLMSRWVIVILVPIGCVLIILAAMMKNDPSLLARKVTGHLFGAAGSTALLLCIWTLASLLWSPAPGLAAEKIVKMLGVATLGFTATVALPARMRATNLHLVTIGVALGALLVLLAWAGEAKLLGDYSFKVPAGTPGRAVILLSCLGWAGAAWLMIKDRRVLATLLMGLVFAAALVQPGGDAVIPIGIGFLVFSAAWIAPERTGRLVGVAAALIILLAPVIAAGADALSRLSLLPPESFVARFGLWWAVFASDVTHLITGRGFEAAIHAREVGFIPEKAPITLLSDIWFDLGLVGAVALAALVLRLFDSAGRFGYEVSPLALAGLSSALTFALIERAATQTWWLNGMVVFAVVLMSVERGRYRTVRPRASVGIAAAMPSA